MDSKKGAGSEACERETDDGEVGGLCWTLFLHMRHKLEDICRRIKHSSLFVEDCVRDRWWWKIADLRILWMSMLGLEFRVSRVCMVGLGLVKEMWKVNDTGICWHFDLCYCKHLVQEECGQTDHIWDSWEMQDCDLITFLSERVKENWLEMLRWFGKSSVFQITNWSFVFWIWRKGWLNVRWNLWKMQGLVDERWCNCWYFQRMSTDQGCLGGREACGSWRCVEESQGMSDWRSCWDLWGHTGNEKAQRSLGGGMNRFQLW